MTYAATVTCDAGAILSSVGGVLAEINATMRSFGMDETVQARTEIGTFTIQSTVERTAEELEAIRARAEAARESQPTFDFRFGRLELFHG